MPQCTSPSNQRALRAIMISHAWDADSARPAPYAGNDGFSGSTAGRLSACYDLAPSTLAFLWGAVLREILHSRSGAPVTGGPTSRCATLSLRREPLRRSHEHLRLRIHFAYDKQMDSVTVYSSPAGGACGRNPIHS
jgi:hypothetical protein